MARGSDGACCRSTVALMRLLLTYAFGLLRFRKVIEKRWLDNGPYRASKSEVLED